MHISSPLIEIEGGLEEGGRRRELCSAVFFVVCVPAGLCWLKEEVRVTGTQWYSVGVQSRVTLSCNLHVGS